MISSKRCREFLLKVILVGFVPGIAEATDGSEPVIVNTKVGKYRIIDLPDLRVSSSIYLSEYSRSLSCLRLA